MHNIFGSRFYSLRQKPWHNLGIVSEDEISATDAYNRTQPLTIVLQPLFTTLPSLTDPEHRPATHETEYNAITRFPTPDDPQYRIFGTVSKSYRLIDPLTFCEVFDEAVQRPVETIGTLGKGETLFVTTKVNTVNIRGDEVENYLLTVSPYTPGRSIEARITPVRVVCQNTLMAGRQASTETYLIRHDENVLDRTKEWFRLMAGTVDEKTNKLTEMFNVMAHTTIPQEYFEQLLGNIYPDPKKFRSTPEEAVNSRRLQWYEENLQAVKKARSSVTEIFQGRGVGMDTPAVQGTAWGLFNAVVEYEQFRPNRSIQAAANDMLFGGRRDACERSYDVLWDFARVKGPAQL